MLYLDLSPLANKRLIQTQKSMQVRNKRRRRRKVVAASNKQHSTQINYLYNSKQSYPVIEYLPSDEELESASLTLTPSFVLEVTWPRIIQFYHPNSPRCRSFQPTFVNAARGMKRRSSRLPIEFYAVNCGLYRELCELGFHVNEVPTIIGFQSGEIERTALILPGSVDGFADSTKEFVNDVELKMEYIALTMGIPLDPVKGANANTNAAIAMSKGIEKYNQNDQKMDSVKQHSMHLVKLRVRQTEEVFNDAMSSLVTAITSRTSRGKALSSDASDALAEFLDLVRWASPPETKIHSFAEDMKEEFVQVVASEDALLKVVQRHSQQEFTWSSQCTASVHGGFNCGVWSLLHILTVGVAERHSFVLGDTESVSIISAGQVIRSFIEQLFLDCESCRDLWIELFDENCSGMYEIAISKERNANEGKIDDDGWKFLALCVWKMHNDYRQHNMDPPTSLWPTHTDCPKCWLSLPGDNFLQLDSTNRNELYNHLKTTYWQGGIHNNRLIVLNKLSQMKRALSMKRLRARMTANYWSTPLLVMNLFIVCYLIRVFRPRWSSTVLILLCNTFRRGRRVKRSGKHQKTQADLSNLNDPALHSEQSGRISPSNNLPACTSSSSESRYRRSMRHHDGVGHKYATTSRLNSHTMQRC